jgi:hypothetical protein
MSVKQNMIQGQDGENGRWEPGKEQLYRYLPGSRVYMYIHASGSKHCLHSFASHVLSQSFVGPA